MSVRLDRGWAPVLTAPSVATGYVLRVRSDRTAESRGAGTAFRSAADEGLGCSGADPACEDDPVTHIRLAALGDLHDLVEKDRLPEDELSAILGRGRVLVAEDGSREGFIGWLRWGLFWDEVPFMNRLHVAERRRGEGVGGLLVNEWERACVQDGHTTVMTSTLSAESAQHFYRKLGYIDAGCLLLPAESAELFFIKQIA